MSGILDGRRLIGVVHLAPTPGAPAAESGGIEALLERAARDAAAYAEGGIDALVVENFGDAPFEKERVAPETVATLALAVDRVRRTPGIQTVGVNVLRNDARSALGIAAATGARFVRVNVHSGSMYTDQGLVEGRAAETLRTRSALCPDVLLFADVHVKHATPVPGERIEDAARDALHRGRADGLIVSGIATGQAPEPERIARVREAVGPDVPIVVGSGLDGSNAAELLAHADAAIVGTAAKEDGDVSRPVDPARVRALVSAV
ncbi:MAG: BtpA/SgcQ family protein [Planctomycetota bacterium]